MIDPTRCHVPRRTPPRLALVVGCAVALAVPHSASGTVPPSTDPAGSDPPATSDVTGSYESGVFTAPDGSFTANFRVAPGGSADAGSGVVTFLAGADEDTQSVVLFPVTALGATAGSSAVERAELFLAASGTDIEQLANSPTNLGPFPATHFVARLTLADGRRATVYGVLADRGTDVVYTFYTDVGDDDHAAAVAFVQSFAIVLPAPPRPSTTAPTTVAAPDANPPTSAAPPAGAPTTIAAPSTTSGAPTSTTTSTPPPPTVAEAPGGALLGFDGRWWITFPADAPPTFRAFTDEGFATAEYLAVDGDDTLVVRVTEVPGGYEWNAEPAPAAVAERIGGEVLESTTAEHAGRPAVRLRLAQADSDTSGDTVEVLVVDGGDQIYSVEFWDGGASSADRATEFIESFGLA